MPFSKADDLVARSEKADGLDGRPNTYVQWQGSDLCLDFNCPCGNWGHLDVGFLFALRCASCGRSWRIAPALLVSELKEGDPQPRTVIDLPKSDGQD